MPVFGYEMYGLRPDITSYLKEILSASIGCYGPTPMPSSNAYASMPTNALFGKGEQGVFA